MLTEIDRLQLAVPDRAAAASGWMALLGAEPVGEDRIAVLGALRMRLRIGQGFVELLEPDGAGIIADALAARGPHMFAAGAATREMGALTARLDRLGVPHADEAGQVFVGPAETGIAGLRLVVSAYEKRPSVGLVDFLYEATLLTDAAEPAVAELARLLGVNRAAEVPISSDKFGYSGTLTLFQAGRLHRFEIIAPTREGTTMARHLSRFGPALYMAFGESSHIRDIEARARAAGAGITVDRPDGRPDDRPADQLWLHPPALGGMMLGISRPTMAWHWSGAPERVAAVA